MKGFPHNIIQLASDLPLHDYPEVLFEDSYSGRGMYGDQCVGFRLPNTLEPIDFFAALVRLIAERQVAADPLERGEPMVDTLINLSEIMEDSRIDSMGLGKILYFPSYAHEEEV